jgi:hypothetical protein
VIRNRLANRYLKVYRIDHQSKKTAAIRYNEMSITDSRRTHLDGTSLLPRFKWMVLSSTPFVYKGRTEGLECLSPQMTSATTLKDGHGPLPRLTLRTKDEHCLLPRYGESRNHTDGPIVDYNTNPISKYNELNKITMKAVDRTPVTSSPICNRLYNREMR